MAQIKNMVDEVQPCKHSVDRDFDLHILAIATCILPRAWLGTNDVKGLLALHINLAFDLAFEEVMTLRYEFL